VVELPLARKQRFMRNYQLPPSDAEVFKNNTKLGDSFEEGIRAFPEGIQGEQRTKLIKLVANLLINSSRSKNVKQSESSASEPLNIATPYPIGEVVNLAILIQNNTINISIAQQEMLPEIVRTGKLSTATVQANTQVSDTAAIEKFCDEAIAANPNPVTDYRAGKVAALNSLKGQVMKLSKGKANPALVGEILERKLKA
jgi:aspartyl-tRNA(Asn)/glutamyl-tRNA(Gln) amidotransferase subunit B